MYETKELTETQKAYIAGLVDGEGCITITKYQGKNNRTPVFTPLVTITMVEKSVIEWAHELTGYGSVSSRNMEGFNAQYRWSVNSPAQIAGLLKAIQPYMIVKAKEAKALLDFLALPKAPQMGKGYAIPAFYVNQREDYYRRLRDLKAYGKQMHIDQPEREIAPIDNPQMALFDNSCCW